MSKMKGPIDVLAVRKCLSLYTMLIRPRKSFKLEQTVSIELIEVYRVVHARRAQFPNLFLDISMCSWHFLAVKDTSKRKRVETP